ncbi:MAG: ABC transporter substrate-binding protein [Phycisphaerales bacterium]
MGQYLPQTLVLVLLAVLIGAPIAWRPAEAVPAPDARRLVVLTSHNEQIRQELGIAFNTWHQTHFGEPVEIIWRVGGSSEVQRILQSQYQAELEQAIAQGREIRSVGYDVVFGGGDYIFDKYFKRVGVSAEVPAPGGGEPVTRQVSITQPIELPSELIERVFGDGMIADAKTRDPDGHWWGVILSSFGIVYNRDAFTAMQLEEPTRWEQLADPKLLGWIAMADPSHSGSVRVTYNAILQRLGWDKGWWVLRRSFANARYFATSSTKVPLDVSAGDSAAGICIDFYGRFQSQAVGGDRVGFAAPAAATVYACDPVAVLNGVEGERLELAKRFILFQLSYEGQAVWNFKVGDPDGPKHFELRRPPVSHEMYTPDRMARMVDPVNYYTMAKPLEPGTPNYMGTVSEVLHAMAIDTHDDLVEAWRTICDEADPQRKAAMIALFDALPFTEAELNAKPDEWNKNPDQRELDRIAWSEFFTDRYRRIVRGDLSQ